MYAPSVVATLAVRDSLRVTVGGDMGGGMTVAGNSIGRIKTFLP